MKILFFSPDYAIEKDHPSWNGAAFYRCVLPAKALGEHGHETRMTAVPLQNDQTNCLAGFMDDDSMWDDAELVVLHAWTVRGGAEQIERARHAGQKVIGDIDDLMWELPIEHRATTWDSMQLRDRNFYYLRNNLLACDAITVSTPYLANWIVDHWGCPPEIPPVYVVRNAIDLDNFTPGPFRDEVRTIGWNGNLSWRADDFAEVRPWLRDFLERHDLRFVYVGYHPTTSHIFESLNLPPERVEERPIQRFADFHNGHPLQGIDLQIIPLEDCPYNRAKSALKGLESAAWGVPFVATNLPEYESIFGGLAGNSLRTHLELVVDNPKLRDKQLEYQQTVAEHHDIEVRWSDWDKIYREVLTK